jgi:hypothetical protein
MQGHMRKRGANTWQLLVRGKDQNGRRRYVSKTVRGSARHSSPSPRSSTLEQA